MLNYQPISEPPRVLISIPGDTESAQSLIRISPTVLFSDGSLFKFVLGRWEIRPVSKQDGWIDLKGNQFDPLEEGFTHWSYVHPVQQKS